MQNHMAGYKLNPAVDSAIFDNNLGSYVKMILGIKDCVILS
jgi:hypothetical protein